MVERLVPPRSVRRVPLRTNLWLLPLLMSLAACLLFGLTRALDEWALEHAITLPEWLATRSVSDAQVLLAALLAVNGTVIAFVFSTTMVTITLAAAQLGPRLIRRFMRDRVTQTTIGLFVAAFVFTLLSLGSVRADDADQVPQVSTAVAVLLTLLAFGALVYYVSWPEWPPTWGAPWRSVASGWTASFPSTSAEGSRRWSAPPRRRA
jgi:uncharacterized membrane protein